MSPKMHAIRVGLGRGWTEFKQSLRSPQDQVFYLMTAGATLAYLWFRRNTEIEGTGLMLPSVSMPSILGALIAFGVVVGPAYSLAMEREDGTLLRSKAVPHGMLGYVTGQLTYQSANLVPSLASILIPGFFLFDNLMHKGASGWLTMLWVTVLGLLATMPLGIIIGSLVPGTQKVGTWGMLPIMVLAGISGVFTSMDSLWGWVQNVAQVFPMYWLALGMRSAFLPDAAAAVEITGSWRTLETVVVLSLWALFGLVVAPIVLRRMAQRQSGSAVEKARETAGQWLR
ncbi:MAG TPA: ABC transporter permease [Actinomycetota bacterium]|jgi:ABC-2 type transport system permease protein|nr:ABC transporter permease [Actinomycetota bacterium]